MVAVVFHQSLKGLLVKGELCGYGNRNTMMIKSTIAAMLSAMSNYQVQLVILEPNETLDSDEIKFGSLTKLKLMYPSVTRDNILPESVVFEHKFKKANSIFHRMQLVVLM
jgi:hypothetical protein